ncbi:aldo/keto reductase [Micromonospora sp. NBC_01813]|uniref:aldo/keto reductase n=1 Tax=Micromonospora sp. NBC_01813 TaxID=2975988 RepID=UPI002DD892A3|nr:aldo/keto reductase [Micromonospora sp. NBC_01813]WSA12138.1 aldo/keto reductase [Micromonospora sp. NBC_01813]
MAADGERSAVTLVPGVEMPMLGFGTWQATGEAGYRAVRAALDAGYRHLDTATMYGNEAQVGAAIKDSGLARQDIFVTTKLPPERVGQEARTLAESLAALGTDYVDLWLIHWPPGAGAGVPTWREFIAQRDAGAARAIGVSNHSLEQIDELTERTGVTPAVNQVPWAPAMHDERTVAEHQRRGVVVEGYSPFKNTNLDDPVLTRVARRHQVSAAQVVLRWHLQHGIVVIPKSVTPERIASNLDVFGFTLTAAEMSAIDDLRD